MDVLNADQAAKRRFGWKGWEIHNHARDRNHTHDTLNPKLMGGILGWVRAADRGEHAMSPTPGDIAAIAHRPRRQAPERRMPFAAPKYYITLNLTSQIPIRPTTEHLKR